jgi:hypothetical protein
MHISWCLFRIHLSLNDLLHISQVYRHSPPCSLMSLKIALITDRLITHVTATQTFPTVRAEMYWKGFLLTKDLWHKSQEYGRSPLCICLCFIRTTYQLNDLPHTSQQYGCSPLWVCRCTFISTLPVNILLHTLQKHGCSLLCTHWCVFR